MTKVQSFEDIPISRIVEVGRIDRYPGSGVMIINWVIDRFCNYACSYCWPSAHSTIRTTLDADVLIGAITTIREKANTAGLDKFSYALSGGEATLHPAFLDLMAEIGRQAPLTTWTRLSLTTNLSHGTRWWQRFIEATAPVDQLSVSASWHHEYAKDRDAFAEKVDLLRAASIWHEVSLVADPTHFDAVIADARYFADRGLNVVVRTMRDPVSPVGALASGYTEEMLRVLRTLALHRPQKARAGRCRTPELTSFRQSEDGPVQHARIHAVDDAGDTWLLDNEDRMVAVGLHAFKGWSCDAGMRSIVIDANGMVSRGHTCKDRHLGSLQRGFDLLDAPRHCRVRSCGCSADLAIPKRRPSPP